MPTGDDDEELQEVVTEILRRLEHLEAEVTDQRSDVRTLQRITYKGNGEQSLLEHVREQRRREEVRAQLRNTIIQAAVSTLLPLTLGALIYVAVLMREGGAP